MRRVHSTVVWGEDHGVVQGYLAHKKPPPLLGLSWGPMHRATVGSCGGGVSYERGTPEAHLIGAVLLNGLRLVEALERAVVPLVQPPRLLEC